MRRWLIAATAATTVAVASPLLATANGQPRHTCSIKVTAHHVGIAVLSGKPPESGSETGASIVDGTLCGRPFQGAARDIDHFPKLGKVNATGTMFGPLGSITFRFEATAQIKHGRASLHGKATITGGAGLYKAASGSGSITGSQPANSDVTTEHLTGSLTY